MATTYEDVLNLFREVAEAQKETDQKFRDTERSIKELLEAQKETDRKFQQTDKKIQTMADTINKLGHRLGDYIEDAVRPAAVRLFRERGIDVHEVHQNVSAKRDGEEIEVDVLVVNDTETIAIECKSLLSVDDVNEHRERLDKFKRLLPRYAHSRVLGAVTAMVIPDHVARYAYRQGFYVIGQSGEQLIIRNDERFRPRAW